MVFFFASAIFIWWVEAFPQVVCKFVRTTIDLDGLAASTDLVLVNGNVINITLINALPEGALKSEANAMGVTLRKYVGRDASKMFPRIAFLGRQFNKTNYDLQDIDLSVSNYQTADNFVNNFLNYNNLTINDGAIDNCPVPVSPRNRTSIPTQFTKCYYSGNSFRILQLLHQRDFLWYTGDIFVKPGAGNFERFLINQKVYDVTDFMKVARVIVYPGSANQQVSAQQIYIRSENLVFPYNVTMKLVQAVGTDATSLMSTLPKHYLNAFDRLFYVGIIAQGEPLVCTIIQPLLLVCAMIVIIITVIKFFLSLNFGIQPIPAYQKEYVMLFVPCYTEGTQSLKKTIDSLGRLDYDDKRKLLFVVCDGNLTGAGNAKSTPRLVLDILGYNSLEPESYKYESLGIGEKSQNRAKVYCGYYHINSHIVPYVVVVKVGNVLEKEKPGNRGKRDSQLILMNFLNRIMDDSRLLTPLEHEMFFAINTVLEVNPRVYDFVLMVDADTEAEEASLNAMIAKMTFDSRTIGLCGETQVQNRFDSFTTMVQVYEYYISHHLGKSFESLFGSVTCLPGCFSLYRIKSQSKKLFLASDAVIADYSVNTVDTLHLKNLLHLGEDRYLTTLLLKYFPRNHLRFVDNAKCWTIIPDSFSILLSQRRRWINSTIHNLFELLMIRNLCGVSIFSLKTVIVMDLIGTILMPTSLLYFYYTVIKSMVVGFDSLAIVVASFFGVYALHLIIFLSKRQFEYSFWLLVYMIFSLPVFCIILPLYSFWHFDDFSWGKTRQIEGDNGGGDHSHGMKKLDTNLVLPPVPRYTLSKYMETDPRYQNSQLRAKPAFNSQIVFDKKKGLNLSLQRIGSKRSIYEENQKNRSPLAFSSKKYIEPDASPLSSKSQSSLKD